MVKIYINNNKHDVDESKNLLQICLSLNIDIPYFCWHPELGSVGFCRVCSVTQHNNLNDKSGRIIMSCITSPTEDMVISTYGDEVKKFRRGIIELLMLNHPHDCPICEEGGNCHLQDMTVLVNHSNRRYIFPKRIHYNQYLGNFISHQMNRCIGCYRCVRYYKDYAGGEDFGVFGMNNKIYFGRFEDGHLESEHSGNLIEVCPTGVFTDKLSSKNYNRKWDLQCAPSICQHCSIGCNTSVGEKHGKISKIENRYHEQINRYFLCDLGRFGYNYTNLTNRITYPIYKNNLSKKFDINTSVNLVSDILSKNNRVAGIGSNRSSIENNFALRKLVGKDNFSHGMSSNDANCIRLIVDIIQNSGIHIPTLSEIESYDVVLIIGEDITQTSPRIDLSIRQLNKKNQEYAYSKSNIPKWHSTALLNNSNSSKFVYIIYTHETKLDNISQLNYYGSIQEQEILAYRISNRINKITDNSTNCNSGLNNYIDNITQALLLSKNPLIISGSHLNSISLIKSSLNIAKGLQKLEKSVGLILLTPSANSIGSVMMSHISINNIFKKINNNQIDTLIILENDLYRVFLKKEVDIIFKKIKNIIVFDHIITDTALKSTILFPICNVFEGNGTFINYEARAQRSFSVFDPKIYNNSSCILEGWKWLYKIYFQLNNFHIQKINFDDIIQEYIQEIQLLNKIKNVTPGSKFRILNQKIARSPHRSSSRTAIFSHINIHEPGQKIDHNSMFNFSMEGNQQPNKKFSYVPFVWSPGWNSLNASNKYIFSSDQYNSGIRLFQPFDNPSYFFNGINCSYQVCHDWVSVPYYKIFLNEELSQRSHVIQKEYPDNFVLISIQYKKILNLNSNSIIYFSCLGQNFQFNIQFSIKLPLKHIGIPVGFKNIPRVLIGQRIKNVRGIMNK